LLKRKTDQLSGGERQRIALAKLLITSPKLLLLDEPFSHLDLLHKDTLKSVIADISRKLKITCILVSHDPGDTLAWADKIILLKDGAVIQQGSPQQVYRKPVNEYAAGLLGHYSILSDEHAEALGYKKIKGKRILTRPESFRIVTRGRNTLAGVVEEVRFTGGQKELVVRVDDNLIRANGDEKVTKRGDKIKLSLQDDPYRIKVQ
jgi:iron(III) transport system ATP-binding protein